MNIKALFQRQDADHIRLEQLFEAERQAVQHEAAAEHHAALAVMYAARVVRLNAELKATKEPS